VKKHSKVGVQAPSGQKLFQVFKQITIIAKRFFLLKWQTLIVNILFYLERLDTTSITWLKQNSTAEK
jgi:hypothetical protein